METPKDRHETEADAGVPESNVALPGLAVWGVYPHQAASQAGRYDLGSQGFGDGIASTAAYYEGGASDGLPQTHPDQAAALYSPEE